MEGSSGGRACRGSSSCESDMCHTSSDGEVHHLESSDSEIPFDYPVQPKLGGHGKNGVYLTAGIIVADVVGAGILGMPRAIARFGWCLGAVVLVFMLMANVHISILMWKVRVSCPDCANAHTFVGLLRGAYKQAPRWQRRSILVVTGVSQYAFLFGLMGLYLLSAGKGLGMVFYQYRVCLPKWSCGAAVMLLPFAGTAREMGSYKSLVWINIVTLCGSVLIPLGYYVVVGTGALASEGAHWYTMAELEPAGVLSGLSTFTFGLTSQFMLTEIISEMKDPMQLPKAYAKISAPFQLAAFAAAGLGGYYFFGDQSAGMMNENLPFNVVFQVAAACLVIHMLISYLIKSVVFCGAILKNIAEEFADPNDARKRSLAAWNGVVIPTLAFAWLLANLVPFFGDAVDLLGATFTPLSCWIIPLFAFIRYWYDAGESRPHVGFVEWVCIALELSLAFVLMFAGTYTSLKSVLEHWSTYGPPFDCHCEGIWDTCECSADHIGMSCAT